MQVARHRLEGKRHELGRLTQEAGDRFRHETPLLRLRTALDQHFKIELLAREPLKRVLADRAELILVHVSEHALFKIGIAQATGIIVAQHALNVGGGQDLAHDIEDGVVLQRVADFLQLFKQAP